MSNNRKKASEVSEPTGPACGSDDLRHEAGNIGDPYPPGYDGAFRTL